jgi:hypothetical protein
VDSVSYPICNKKSGKRKKKVAAPYKEKVAALGRNFFWASKKTSKDAA